MEKKGTSILRHLKHQTFNLKPQRFLFLFLMFAVCGLRFEVAVFAADPVATAASAYDPATYGELSWTNNELYARPYGSYAYLANNSPSSNYLPWWQTDVA